MQGDLNADYAVRVSKFLEAYNKTVAPAIANDDSTKEPVFKGYEVKTNLRPYVHFTIIFANIRFVQKFEYKTELGTCGAFPYGYVATDASAEVEKFNQKLENISTNNDSLITKPSTAAGEAVHFLQAEQHLGLGAKAG